MAKIQNTDNTQWQECRSTGTLIRCCWNAKTVQPLLPLLEDRQFLIKLNILLPYDPAIMLLGIFPNELKFISTQNLHMNVYRSIIFKCQNMETIKMSFNRWINKILVCPYKGFSINNNKKAVKPWKHREEYSMHIAKWKKPNMTSYYMIQSINI